MIIHYALLALRPNAEFTVRGDSYSDIEWFDTSQTIPTESELTAKIEELTAEQPLNELREERNYRLAATDWWASSDLTMTSEQTAYRQALRDITKTYSSVDNVVWPEKP